MTIVERTIQLTTALEDIPDVSQPKGVTKKYVAFEIGLRGFRVRVLHAAGYGYEDADNPLEDVSDKALLEAYSKMGVIAREIGRMDLEAMVQERILIEQKIMAGRR